MRGLDFRVCGWATASMGRSAIEALRASVRAVHADDAIVESCQRIEAYGTGACTCQAPLQLIARDALFQLAEVAAGLHSAVLGEEQILGQVRAAFADIDGSMRRLAETAIAAARELRRETQFESHAGHLLDRGLRLAGVEPAGSLLVLGTGAMGRLVAARGVDLGFDEVIIAGRRRPEREIEGARWVSLSTLAHEVEDVDVIAGCLGSGAATIVADGLPRLRRLALDLGTPRNFEGDGWPQLLTIANLLSDELGRPHARARRAALAETLRTIVRRRLAAAEGAASGVGAMRESIERIRQQEAARTRRLHPEIAPDVVDAITRGLVNQILHAPSTRLRALGDPDLERKLVALFA